MDTTKLSTDELRAYWEEKAFDVAMGEDFDSFKVSCRHAVTLEKLNIHIGHAVRLGDGWSKRACILMQEGSVFLLVDDTITEYHPTDDAVGIGLVAIMRKTDDGVGLGVQLPMRVDAISSHYAMARDCEDNTRIIQPNT